MSEIIAFPQTATPVNPAPIAMIRGEPMIDMPRDLYIPPDALEVFLDMFEGPLDLLLYLIRKANIDILDIPMAPLTRQYLEYVEIMRTKNLELAAEYLLMAAMLIEIKSRMLLPRPPVAHEEDLGDPRAELVRRLLVYEQMKAASQQINALPTAGRDFEWVEVWVERTVAPRLPEVQPADLVAAWKALVLRARISAHHKVSREQLSVREHMGLILRRLQTQQFVEFCDLFDPADGVPTLVVNFLAVLELARESMIELTQSEPMQPIYVKIRAAEIEAIV